MSKKPTYEDLERKIKALEKAALESRRVQDELRESEERFRALADTTPTGIMLHQNDRWVSANSAAEAITGYSREELQGMNFWDVVHPDHRDFVRKRGRKRQQGEEASKHYEIKIFTKDGREKWVDIAGAPATIEGRPAVVTSVIDITAHKEAEKALAESEERFRRLAENAQDMIYRMSLPDGKYEYISPSSKDMVGFTPEEHYNGTVEIKKLIHPDFAEYFNEQWENLLRGEIPAFYEYKIIHREKGERWLHQRNVPVRDENGLLIAIEGIVSDITYLKRTEEAIRDHRDHLDKLVQERTAQIEEEFARRRQKEEQYLALVESVVEWIWETDAKFVHTYVSPRIYDVLGYKPEDLIGRSPADIMPPDEAKRAMPLIKKVFSKRGLFVSFQTIHVHKDGRMVFVEANGRPFFDQKGRLLGYRGSCRDITEQKRTMDNLREYGQELTVKSRTLEEVNAALRVLLKQREDDREELEDKFVSNIRKMVFPYIIKLQKEKQDLKHKTYLDIIAANLNEIITPFLSTIRQMNFTPREIEVASLIKEGRRTREIAELMGVAPSAVDSHRNNIRIKLGLNKKKVNLRSYLLSLK